MKRTEIRKLDKIWAERVKERAGNKCEKCGKRQYLNSHHIFSRSNHSMRWNVENGVCLDSGCHTLKNDSAHKAPVEFIEWLRETRGEEWYNDLRREASKIKKLTYKEVWESLK